MLSQMYTQDRKSICNRKNQIAKFDKFNTIFENLKHVEWFSMFICKKKRELANVFYSKNPLHNNNHE